MTNQSTLTKSETEHLLRKSNFVVKLLKNLIRK